MIKCILFVSVNAQNLADKSIIVISSAHAADAGTYKCIARNQYENDTATTIVTITGEYYGNTFLPVWGLIVIHNTLLYGKLCYFGSLQLKHSNGLSKKRGKDQEWIHSITTPDPGYQWESDNFTIRHHKRDYLHFQHRMTPCEA